MDTNFINLFSSMINNGLLPDLSNNDLSNNDLLHNAPILYGLINGLNNNSNIQNILQTSLEQKNKYIQVISENGLEQLEHTTYKENEITKCPITYIDFKEGDKIIKLPCDHIFDEESILQWLNEESNKCPVCRFSLDFKEKQIEPNTPQPNAPNAQNTQQPPNNMVFANFVNNYYQRQEDRMVQIALQRSLIENNNEFFDEDELLDELLNEDELFDDNDMNMVD